MRRDAEGARRRNDEPGQSRGMLITKLVIAAAAGAAWGYYVSRSTGGEWPNAFWSFCAIGVVAWLLFKSGVSNEHAARNRVRNRLVRHMVTFTPQRFATLAGISAAAAAGVAVGFFLAG